jgi:hypothetical protein
MNRILSEVGATVKVEKSSTSRYEVADFGKN